MYPPPVSSATTARILAVPGLAQAMAGRFGNGEGREARQGDLAAPAPGLGDQAVQPFEVHAAEPGRGAPGVTAQVVEHAADADADRDVQGGQVAVQPLLLLGRAVS